MNEEKASEIAISGLNYIAGDENELSRFVTLTGVELDSIREIAGTNDFMCAVLDYFLGNEPTLLAFSAHSSVEAQDILKAKIALSGPHDAGGW